MLITLPKSLRVCDLGIFYHRVRRGRCGMGSERKRRFESIGECVDTEKSKKFVATKRRGEGIDTCAEGLDD